MLKVFQILFLTLLSFSALSQNPNIPKDLKLKEKEDYKKNETLVLESIDWFQKTPTYSKQSTRKEVAAFLMEWMSGSPTVTIEIREGLAALDCGDCLLTFMNGWTKYSLTNNYSKDNIKCALAGVEQAIEFYIKNKSELGKSKDVEKLIKLKKKGQLEAFIASKFE